LATHRHLANAPITEAVIDFSFEPRPDRNFSQLEQAYKELDFGYRQLGSLLAGFFQFQASDTSVAVQQSPEGSQRIGLRLQSDNDKYVALVRLNGMSVSRLPPYETFEALEQEMRRLWAIYINRWGPAKIKRVACRFINNLKLPLKHSESFGTYIHTLIEIPPDLPQNIGSFFQQFVIQDQESLGTVRLSLGWDGQGAPLSVPVILDLDAFMLGDFDVSDESAWSVLGVLRKLKNRCFFGTLTEECVKLYE
jgi:uncharacterized protein (TIGR04255 family)